MMIFYSNAIVQVSFDFCFFVVHGFRDCNSTVSVYSLMLLRVCVCYLLISAVDRSTKLISMEETCAVLI